MELLLYNYRFYILLFCHAFTVFFHSPSPNLCNILICKVKINKIALFTLSALKGQLKNAHGKLITLILKQELD